MLFEQQYLRCTPRVVTGANRAHTIRIVVVVAALVLLASRIGFAQSASGLTTIDFENLSGPSLFSVADPTITIDSATFSGGQLLTNATYLPADPTSVYGTSYFCTGCADTITIDFAQKISNFSMLLLNGLDYTVTYTVEDDQGGTQQLTLVANGDSGATTVSLKESGIRQVVISADPNTFDFEIDNVQFSATNVSLIDPVASNFLTQFANSGFISTDTNLLASGGSLVQGASADGVTQVLVRIPAPQPNTTYSLSLLDENGNSSTPAEIGGLFKLGDDPKNAATNLIITSVNTASGPMAYAVYLAPTDFARQPSDDALPARPVTLQVAGGGQFTGTINIVRPPVILIHGLWDSLAEWVEFEPSLKKISAFNIYLADYSGFIGNVTATTPSYSDAPLDTLRLSAVGFDYNAPRVEHQIRAHIKDFKTAQNVAAVQADLVGHSMGGNISRDIATLGGFTQGDTYGKGFINKLITIGTPHWGTPLAVDLLSSSNSCTAGRMASKGQNPAFTSLTIDGATVSGAVADLEGAGDGTALSPVLTKLKSTALPFPVAYIAATSGPANWADLGKLPNKSWQLKNLACRSDPLAQALSSTGWPTLFSGGSDSVVPETSQLNGQSNGAGGPFTGIIHSSGLETLNFSPPAEVDDASGIVTEVGTLLNEAKSGSDFHPYGGAQ